MLGKLFDSKVNGAEVTREFYRKQGDARTRDELLVLLRAEQLRTAKGTFDAHLVLSKLIEVISDGR